MTKARETLGFEDFCSLQALGTDRKYNNTYESVARTIKDFVSTENLAAARESMCRRDTYVPSRHLRSLAYDP
jgi:serine/threonine-protein kinase HipA